MKKDKAAKKDIDVAVAELKRLKGICEMPAGSAPAKTEPVKAVKLTKEEAN
jgi:hypothetical protein